MLNKSHLLAYQRQYEANRTGIRQTNSFSSALSDDRGHGKKEPMIPNPQNLFLDAVDMYGLDEDQEDALRLFQERLARQPACISAQTSLTFPTLPLTENSLLVPFNHHGHHNDPSQTKHKIQDPDNIDISFSDSVSAPQSEHPLARPSHMESTSEEEEDSQTPTSGQSTPRSEYSFEESIRGSKHRMRGGGGGGNGVTSNLSVRPGYLLDSLTPQPTHRSGNEVLPRSPLDDRDRHQHHQHHQHSDSDEDSYSSFGDSLPPQPGGMGTGPNSARGRVPARGSSLGSPGVVGGNVMLTDTTIHHTPFAAPVVEPEDSGAVLSPELMSAVTPRDIASLPPLCILPPPPPHLPPAEDSPAFASHTDVDRQPEMAAGGMMSVRSQDSRFIDDLLPHDDRPQVDVDQQHSDRTPHVGEHGSGSGGISQQSSAALIRVLGGLPTAQFNSSVSAALNDDHHSIRSGVHSHRGGSGGRGSALHSARLSARSARSSQLSVPRESGLTSTAHGRGSNGVTPNSFVCGRDWQLSYAVPPPVPPRELVRTVTSGPWRGGARVVSQPWGLVKTWVRNQQAMLRDIGRAKQRERVERLRTAGDL
eukprot:gnl/Dysnectes_brevis/4067_a5328_882.p1 GENE.gnl/Dysnectes_brevis/4067_a5328_882~~gnl/Dysnectes_brevis/4067_a5328_882.p1  ORF type:complete len:590 (+),score=71.71 gnl/Dysnectes_brevis/4067_a5328_882:160-1929(+)